jgi:phage host-nuclease inhibitor protein Gam
MARKKVEVELAIKSWDEADETLRRIGELGMLKKTRESRAQLKIDEIKAATSEAIKPLSDEIKQLERDMKSFSEAERAKQDFRTRALVFGAVFFRQRTGLRTLKKWTWQKAAEAASRLGMMDVLQVSYEIKRDELRNSDYRDDVLATVGVERYSERPFTYELNEEKFEQPQESQIARIE